MIAQKFRSGYTTITLKIKNVVMLCHGIASLADRPRPPMATRNRSILVIELPERKVFMGLPIGT